MSRGPFTRNADAKTGLYSPTGAWGDPTLATVKKGRTVLDHLIREVGKFLAEFAKPDFAPAPARKKYLE
jgi:creatinine amidohydrolase/Fe(II)-dependent formamide hydrolase-like protein